MFLPALYLLTELRVRPFRRPRSLHQAARREREARDLRRQVPHDVEARDQALAAATEAIGEPAARAVAEAARAVDLDDLVDEVLQGQIRS